MSNFAPARVNMVEGQIRPNHVTDPALIVALESVPRELFVPKAVEGVAYVDEEISLGYGRSLLEPMVLARLFQAAEIKPQDTVLDVGCASGYSTAVLARLAKAVVAVESQAELVALASKTLAEVRADALVIEGVLTDGYPQRAPYNAIVINGAVAEVPQTLLHQLAEGGRLVAVVLGDHPFVRLGQARLYRRIGDNFPSVPLFETTMAILPGFEPKPRFVF
jgi:protein-L-isoaspartate(D-aspartate) O-methyltransferase